METSSTKSKSSKLSPLKKTLTLLAKFSMVGVVFYFLAKKGLISSEQFFALANKPSVLAGILFLVLLNTVLGTLRWRVLLGSQGVQMNFKDVLELNLIGNFFNIALPGAVSGDVVKAVIVSKRAAAKRAECFGSILFDRILGVTALVIVATVSTVLSYLPGVPYQLPTPLLMSVLFCGLGTFGFFVYLFLSTKVDPVGKMLRHFAGRNKIAHSLSKIYQSILLYRAQPKRLVKAILLSLLIHIVIVSLTFLVSFTIAETHLSFMILAIIVPIGMLATAVPVLPAGVGTGHAAFYALFKLAGSQDGIAVFNWIVLSQIFIGLIGGVVYLLSNLRKEGLPETETEVEA